jgi:hypothetical protein
LLTDSHLLGYLLVLVSLCHKLHDLKFTRGKR